MKLRKGQTETKEMPNLMTYNLLVYLMQSHTYFNVSCLSGWCCMTLANASYSERNLNSLNNSESVCSRNRNQVQQNGTDSLSFLKNCFNIFPICI